MFKHFRLRATLLSFLCWWILWAIIQAVVLHRLHLSWPIAIIDASVSNLLLAIAGQIIINTYRYYSPVSTNYFYRFGYIILLTTFCISLLVFILKQFFHDQIIYLLFIDESVPVRYMFSLLMITFITTLSELRSYTKEQEENKKRKVEAEFMLRDAELASLRQQMQPHFLFNSLNSISALSGTQPVEARKMIQQLADFLRGTLKKDEHQLVSLEEELSHLQLYLEIEKVRFGHRLQVKTEYAENVLLMKLPSLLLQPVLENAIKFGLYDTTGDVTITLNAKSDGNTLIISIENPYDPSTARPLHGSGFGLNAVARRLHLLYARNDLLITSGHQNKFITTLIIPQNT